LTICMMLPRTLSPLIARHRERYPVIAITGPRQSGKTWVAQSAAADLPYVTLGSPGERIAAAGDPRQFLARFPHGAILDDVQYTPELLASVQVRVDADRSRGRWLITASHQVQSGRWLAQSLAGRVAHLELLPLSHSELALSQRRPRTFAEAVFRGGYPRLYDESAPEPLGWTDQYIADVMDRDVRHLLEVRDRLAFGRFVHLCAMHTGQVVNLSRLGQALGINHNTVSAWMGVLEACSVIRLQRPHDRDFGKRITKAAKLYVVDSGLAARLLHIHDAQQVLDHPHRDALAKTWCVSEILKTRVHRGLNDQLRFWRSHDGLEVEVVIEHGTTLIPIEIRSSATPSASDGAPIRKLRALAKAAGGITIAPGFIIYGGDEVRQVGSERLIPWHGIAEALAEIP
jgi:predicted AAA+ superfamily ATPase